LLAVVACHVDANGLRGGTGGGGSTPVANGTGGDPGGQLGGHSGLDAGTFDATNGASDGVPREPCAGLPIPDLACREGRTVPVCRDSAVGNQPAHYGWVITCPDETSSSKDASVVDAQNPIDAVERSDGRIATDAPRTDGGTSDLRPGNECLSSSDCDSDQVCTTQDGACIPRLGPCKQGAACPAVCSGICRPADSGSTCGNTTCAPGTRCCNQSCGICAPPGTGCTQQACVSPLCLQDSDCRLVDDYCSGCDCRVLAKSSDLPACPGPGVQCLVAPCRGKLARCVNQACVVIQES
jgi:hypothetical protein